MLNKLEKKDFAFAGLAFFASYLAYLLTVYPTVTTEDSGEFIAAVYHMGVAHPPGYPLYIFLAKIFTLLVPFGNIGWRVNIFSAFFGALTVAVIYLLLKKLLSGRLMPFIGALSASAVTILWTQSVRAEVYSLNSFLLLTIILLIIYYYEHTREKNFPSAGARKYLYWVSFLLGLSLANHPLMYLAGIPLAVFILAVRWQILKNWKFLVGCILLFVLGFSFNLFIPIRASYNPEINWNKPAGWSQMWEHISRDFYAKTAVVEKNLYKPAPSTAGTDIGGFFAYDLWGFHLRMLGLLAGDFSLLIIPLLLAGFIYLYKKDRLIFLLFSCLYFFYGPVAAHLISLGVTAKLAYILYDDLPFFLPVLLICTILSAVGAAELFGLLKEKSRKIPQYILLALVILCIMFLRLPAMNQSGNYVVYDIVKTAFGRLPQDSVLLLEGGDNTIFPLLYIQKVERFRPDIKVYMTAPINIFNYANNYETIMQDNPGRPIYVDYYFRDKVFSYDGLFGRFFPDGIRNDAGRIVSSSPQDVIRGIEAGNLDHYNKYSAANYYFAVAMTMNGDPSRQKEYFEKAMKKAPDSVNLIAKYIGNFLAQMNRFSDALPYLEETVKWMPNDYNAVFQLILSYLVTGRPEKAMEHYNKLNEETRASMKVYWKNIAAQGNIPALNNFLSRI